MELYSDVEVPWLHVMTTDTATLADHVVEC